MRLYKGIIIGLTLAMPTLFYSCSDSETPGSGYVEGTDDTDSYEVTFNISVEKLMPGTRDDEDPGTSEEDEGYLETVSTPYISKGEEIDQLIYAIYSRPINSKDEVPYEIDKTYGIGDNFNTNATELTEGQSLVGFEATDTYHLTIKVSNTKEYKIACWAQSSDGAGVYDTSDLEKITVDYDDAVNNDESRDAFAGCESFRGDVRHQEISVVLRRPFAQINVGTSGADYANLIYDPAMIPTGVTINQSTIKVTGVADQYNVLTGVATASSKEDLVADFAWDYLPAWLPETLSVPTFGEYDDADSNPFVYTEGEQFLVVKLNEEEDLQGYKIKYPTLEYKTVTDVDEKEVEKTQYLTETFKYLSMCYVLVPTNANGSTVGVTFNLQQNEDDGKEPIKLTEKELTHVPVQANYRTNILGGLYTTDDVPDPTSIFTINAFTVILQDNFDYHYVNGWNYKTEEDVD